MKNVINLLVLQCCFHNVVLLRDSYKAAVLEYNPMNTGNRHVDFTTNLRLHLEYLEQASFEGVDIIVFPEDGLTGWTIEASDLPHVSTVVPDPKNGVSPCNDRNGTYSNFLIEFSCACKRHQVYAVLNLIESVGNGDGKKVIYHNTNVAVDRAGVIIARYRKINLFDEHNYQPGPHAVSTFTTDFGVTFGMFICFDIVFKTPSLDVLEDKSVTDIVYSVAWFAQLPFYIANGVQHGYAKSNGVNLLAAGMNDPAGGNGGSGIYLADGRILSTYISGNKGSKLIINTVPKVKSRADLSNACQSSSSMPVPPTLAAASDIRLFHVLATDITNYTVKSLDLNKAEVYETICTEKSNFCCSFNISVNRYSPTWPNYFYKLIAYDGVSAVAPTKNIGVRQCAIVACANDSIASCGGRNTIPPTGINFVHISVSGTFDTKYASYMPATITYDLIPTTEYMFCKKTHDNVEVSMHTTQEHESLLTFGILGRVFSNDDKDPGAADGACYTLANVLCVICAIMCVNAM